jgi:hypothetical protein
MTFPLLNTAVNPKRNSGGGNSPLHLAAQRYDSTSHNAEERKIMQKVKSLLSCIIQRKVEFGSGDK